MRERDLPRSAQFVIKISKFCNLRCTYCYEYLELGNRERMPLAAMRRLFENVALHADEQPFSSADFIWHGGEPFLIPVDYFYEIQDMQEKILGGRVKYSNAVQTNLTVLTEGHLALLRESGLFSGGLGISFDVFGDQRIDKRGKLRTETITANMQKLKDEQIPFGAITVLARNTLPYVEAIYHYFDSLGIECRFLPFYMTAYEGQSSLHALSFEELTGALNLLADAWLTSEQATPVEPVSEFLNYAIAHMTQAPKRFYDRFQSELVYIVNVDGGVWGVGEAYDPKDCYGNLFDSSLGSVLTSPTRRRITDGATKRMEKYCKDCEYFGHCPGSFVASATIEQQRLLMQHGCPVRAVTAHLIARLENTSIKNALLTAGSQRTGNDALRVAL
jgi:uncharacterized protein